MATRTALRKELGMRLGLPFFKRFGTGSITGSASGTTTTLIDTAHLKEVDNFWRGNFIYFPATDEAREISGFTNSTSTVTWLAPIASGTTNSTVYEIWSQISPHEVHSAINRAINLAWPDLFQDLSDETLIINKENGNTYTIPVTMRRLREVHITVYAGTTGTVTSAGTTTQVIDSGASFTSADVGKKIAIYEDDDTCVGELRQISTVDSSTQVTVSVAFSAALDVGAKYRTLDFNDVYAPHQIIRNYQTNAAENPTTIWFGQHLVGYEGFPIKLLYEADYTELSAEASTTTLEDEYIYNEALAHLYLQRLASAPATEVPNWEALQRAYSEQALLYRRAHKRRHKPSVFTRHHSGFAVDNPFRP